MKKIIVAELLAAFAFAPAYAEIETADFFSVSMGINGLGDENYTSVSIEQYFVTDSNKIYSLRFGGQKKTSVKLSGVKTMAYGVHAGSPYYENDGGKVELYLDVVKYWTLVDNVTGKILPVLPFIALGHNMETQKLRFSAGSNIDFHRNLAFIVICLNI